MSLKSIKRDVTGSEGDTEFPYVSYPFASFNPPPCWVEAVQTHLDGDRYRHYGLYLEEETGKLFSRKKLPQAIFARIRGFIEGLDYAGYDVEDT